MGFDVTPATPSSMSACEAALLDERAREVVDPDALAGFGQLLKGCHGSPRKDVVFLYETVPEGTARETTVEGRTAGRRRTRVRTSARFRRSASAGRPRAPPKPVLARAPGELAKPGRDGLFVTTRLALACGARLTGGDGVGGGRTTGAAEATSSLRRRPRQGLSPPLGVISQRHRGADYSPERATSTTKCPSNKPVLHPLVQAVQGESVHHVLDARKHVGHVARTAAATSAYSTKNSAQTRM